MNRFTVLLSIGALLGACAPGDMPDIKDTGDQPDPNAFVFSEAYVADYDRVDRMGMPAIGTAVIASKDAYNMADPEDDAAGEFVGEIVASLEFVHGALDDDLTGLGLVPCAIDDCVAQAAPLVVPDTLKVDIDQAAGFPNGRTLTDPVMDVTLAVILLDLSVEGQTAASLVGVNPTANDKAFLDGFPYLATPH
jgi:hypothetical protein